MSLNDRADAALRRELSRAFPERSPDDAGHGRLADALSKPAHTPGPWQSMHAGTANDEHARCVRSCGGAWIADVLKQGTESDRAANARLIAAAPELLEACKASLRIAQAWHNQATTEGDDAEAVAAEMEIKRLSDVITRASGGAA